MTVADRPHSIAGRWRRMPGDAAAFAILFGVVVMLYLRLPRQGDIWWMDASRHALNGVFVLDFLRAMPWRHPMDFALDYYRQWPALTIGFYPPLFSVVLAASYAIFGTSEAAALIPELGFMLLLGCGAYRLSQHWLGRAPSLAVAVLLIAAPELYYWGQQVMLDVPAYALLIWAAEYHVRYIRGGAARTLYAAVIFAVLAMYMKYNAAFFVGAMILSLLYVRGWRFLLDRTALRAGLLGVVLLLPLLALFYKFSSYNLGQAVSVQDAAAGRWSFAGLTYYARNMGPIISWPTFVLALSYCLALPFVPRLRLPKADAVFLLAWVVFGYVFYTMVAVKEPRHILFITFPLVLACVLLLDRALVRFSWRILPSLALAATVLVLTMENRPVPYVGGMRRAAEDVARIAPPETNVAFWGRLDGTFVYAMRAYTGREDLGVIRLDKLLLSDVAVALERGFSQANFSAAEIVDKLAGLHVQYVVIQTHYGDDIEVVQRLEQALQSDKFQEVERIPMTSNYPFPYINEIVIYRAVAEVPRGRVAPSLEIKILQKSF